MENKTESRKTDDIILSKSQTAIGTEPALFLHGDFLSYYPHINLLGITFENRTTFTKHFEEILEHYNRKFYRLRIVVNKSGVQVPQPFHKSTNNV